MDDIENTENPDVTLDQHIVDMNEKFEQNLICLQKRMNWLKERIASDQRNLTHDKNELRAIRYALGLMQDIHDPIMTDDHNNFWADFFHHFFEEQKLDTSKPENVDMLMMMIYKCIAIQPWLNFSFDQTLSNIIDTVE